MVAAVELHDAIATGEPSGDAEGAHDRFSPRGYEPNLLETGDEAAHGLGQEDFTRGRGAEGRAECCRVGDGTNDGGVGVTEETGAVALDVVEVDRPLDISQRCPCTRCNRHRLATDGGEGANG